MTCSSNAISKSRRTGATLVFAFSVMARAGQSHAQESYRPGEEMITLGGGFFGGVRVPTMVDRDSD